MSLNSFSVYPRPFQKRFEVMPMTQTHPKSTLSHYWHKRRQEIHRQEESTTTNHNQSITFKSSSLVISLAAIGRHLPGNIPAENQIYPMWLRVGNNVRSSAIHQKHKMRNKYNKTKRSSIWLDLKWKGQQQMPLDDQVFLDDDGTSAQPTPTETTTKD